MKSTLSKVLIFAAGAAIGSVATWKLIDAKYRKAVQDEVNAAREYYSSEFDTSSRDEDAEEDEEEPQCKPDETDIRDYATILKGQRYTNYATSTAGTKNEEVEDMAKPYVINPECYGELHNYKCVTLTYYIDDVLTDLQDRVIKDVDNIIGLESLNHFDENEDDPDAVYVRNDKRRIDYEILRDLRAYSEVVNPTAHPSEDE